LVEAEDLELRLGVDEADFGKPNYIGSLPSKELGFGCCVYDHHTLRSMQMNIGVKREIRPRSPPRYGLNLTVCFDFAE